VAYHFQGFDDPNYTQIPDVFFDEVMCHLTEAELRVALYILRRTFGFKKRSDTISFNQFIKGIETRNGEQLDLGCGLRSPTAVSTALQGLEDKGLITRVLQHDPRGSKQATLYTLCFKEHLLHQVEQGTPRNGVGPTPPNRGRLLHQVEIQETVEQKTVLQETEEQDTDQHSTSKASSIEDNLKRRIEQISRSLDDAGHTRSNVTRAARIALDYDDLGRVIACLEDAFYITTQRQATLERPMAYLFETWLEKLKAVAKPGQSLAGRFSHLVEH
jgi:hypothetical protein